MEILQNYLTKTEAKSILETFCETFELVDWSDTRIKNAMLNPEKFCLKIFREGGAKVSHVFLHTMGLLRRDDTFLKKKIFYDLITKFFQDTSIYIQKNKPIF